MRDRADSDRTVRGTEPVSRDHESRSLERLARLGGEHLVYELAAIFLQDTPERLLVARRALDSADAPELARMAHAMKSSGAQLGADSFANACEATEDAAERGDLQRAASFLAAAGTHYATFSAWLIDRVRAGGSPDVRERSSKGPVVAVIEDNADNRLLVDAMLGDRFVLHEYPTGAEALAAMVRECPDLVLLDVSLPGMDGLEVLARMRLDRTLREVPVVALTAHAMTGDRERYLAAGFDDYVAKPILDEDVLVHAIERVLARFRSHRPADIADPGRAP